MRSDVQQSPVLVMLSCVSPNVLQCCSSVPPSSYCCAAVKHTVRPVSIAWGCYGLAVVACIDTRGGGGGGAEGLQQWPVLIAEGGHNVPAIYK